MDAATGRKRPAFDHRAVAASLRHADVEKPESHALPFESFIFEDDRSAISFIADGKPFRCALTRKVRCEAVIQKDREPGLLVSPDGETDLFGLLYRPAGFDPGRRYPVIDSGSTRTSYRLRRYRSSTA